MASDGVRYLDALASKVRVLVAHGAPPETIRALTGEVPASAAIRLDVDGADQAARHGMRGVTVMATETDGDGRVVGAHVEAVDAPDDSGDAFAWIAPGSVVEWNGRPGGTRDWSAGDPRHDIVAVPADLDPADAVALVAPRRALPVASGAHALCLVAVGVADLAIVDGRPEGAIAILRAAGGAIASAGDVTIGGPPGTGPDLAHRLLEVRRAREYRASPGRTREDPKVPVCLEAGRRVHDSARLARAQGCLLGQTAGDALGSLVEFMGPAAINDRYPGDGPRRLADGGTWGTIAGQPTDDTEMALCLARAIIGAGGFDREAVARAYVLWRTGGLPAAHPGERDAYSGTRPYDIGVTTSHALGAPTDADFAAGTVADAATRAAARSIPANGALMRVSSLGVWGAGRDPDHVARAARTDAALTHGHPYAVAASAAFAVAIGHAIWAGAGVEETWQVALDVARGPHGDADVANTIEEAADRPPPDYVTLQGACRIALQNAFYRLLHASSLEEGIVSTVRAGGDTDTTAAIAGALLGAVHGRNAVPSQWRRLILTCRPISLPLPANPIKRPRPRSLWPVDVEALAERLLLAGR